MCHDMVVIQCGMLDVDVILRNVLPQQKLRKFHCFIFRRTQKAFVDYFYLWGSGKAVNGFYTDV